MLTHLHVSLRLLCTAPEWNEEFSLCVPPPQFLPGAPCRTHIHPPATSVLLRAKSIWLSGIRVRKLSPTLTCPPFVLHLSTASWPAKNYSAITDRFSSDDFMGQADLYLDPTQSKKIDQWVTMEQRKPDEFVSGEIRIIVLYEVLLVWYRTILLLYKQTHL